MWMGYDGFQGILVLMEMRACSGKVSFMMDLQEFQCCFDSRGGKDLIFGGHYVNELFLGTHPIDFDPSSQLRGGGESRGFCVYKVF
nr:hypothetical protein CFP56_74438 [Quercus suber]